jgi:UDP-glucose 6-dehydrogenase
MVADEGLKAIVVSQPIFFTAGCAVEDFNWPDRIILGTTSNDAVAAIKQIFHPLVMRGVPVIVTNHATAELVREAATAFVATKISFINELAGLCEKVSADAVAWTRRSDLVVCRPAQPWADCLHNQRWILWLSWRNRTMSRSEC